MTSLLAGRTALVTGASRGIGRAIARALAAEGAHVGALARSAAAVETTCAEIEGAGGAATPVVADLAEREWPDALTDYLARADVVVHNACAYAPYARLERSDPADESLVLATTLTAGLALARAALPGMRARGFGRMIFVGSSAAHLGAAGQAAYATAKAGLAGLARTIAIEAGRDGVTCNVVAPGLVATERIAEAVRPDVVRRIAAHSAAGRPGTPAEVAAVVAFLASPAAAYVTGTVLPVDGGLGLGVPGVPGVLGAEEDRT